MYCIQCIHSILPILTTICAQPLNSLIEIAHQENEFYDVRPNQHTGDLVKQWQDNLLVNPEELGDYFEGDIIIDDIAERNGMHGFRLWNSALVPYEITSDFGEGQALLDWAFVEYHTKTCIRFVPKQPDDIDYIKISNEPTGCWSHVGKQGGPQLINLQYPGCLSEARKGTAVHELMHVLGLGHEHTRMDRDDYVTIIIDNIKEDRTHNFEIEFKDHFEALVPYDFGSLMHYSMYAFSKDYWKLPTLRPKITPKLMETTDFNFNMGQREKFSPLDVIRLNKLYCDKDPVANALDYLSRLYSRKHRVLLDLTNDNVMNTPQIVLK